MIDLPPSVRHAHRRITWRERHLEHLMSAWNASVLISPTPDFPPSGLKIPVIVVVHDIAPLQAPAIYGRARWATFALGIPLALGRADHVVCASNTTRLALRQWTGFIRAPCTVIGESDKGISVPPRAVTSPPYVLTLGSMLAHENITTLLQALNDERLTEVTVVLAGSLTHRERPQLAEWRALMTNPGRMTHIETDDLARIAELYAGAAVVALPSLYECSGLPLLEAMRAGVPVVASALPAFREVGADVPIFLDHPLNPSAWAHAIAKIIHDEDFSARISRRAVEHILEVSWENVGRRMAVVSRDVAAAALTADRGQT